MSNPRTWICESEFSFLSRLMAITINLINVIRSRRRTSASLKLGKINPFHSSIRGLGRSSHPMCECVCFMFVRSFLFVCRPVERQDDPIPCGYECSYRLSVLVLTHPPTSPPNFFDPETFLGGGGCCGLAQGLVISFTICVSPRSRAVDSLHSLLSRSRSGSII